MGNITVRLQNMWIAMIAVGFFPLMHAALMSRSNLANSNMCIF